MVSFAAQRVGHSMLSFELASRSRSLAFTVVSVERQRQHPTRPFHSGPHRSTTFNQPSQQPNLQPRATPIRSITTQPPRLQQPSTQPTSSSSTPPPPPPSQRSTTNATTTLNPAPPRTTTPPPRSPTETPDPILTDITTHGLSDAPPPPAYTPSATSSPPIDWSHSFHGLSSQPFSPETSSILLAPINPSDIELKPDGLIYLPEIKYRRILNRAFGPGGWGLAPRSETIITARFVTREYALLAHGRLVSVARGEQEYFDKEGIPTATEGCKSNALMRCCKDLGVASELWDPQFVRGWVKEHAREVWVEHVQTKKRRRVSVRKGEEVGYPYKEVK